MPSSSLVEVEVGFDVDDEDEVGVEVVVEVNSDLIYGRSGG